MREFGIFLQTICTLIMTTDMAPMYRGTVSAMIVLEVGGRGGGVA